ncbi:hypothetical protein M422DRAFT_785236, partial [Sphaerobolus stellatus SS14]
MARFPSDDESERSENNDATAEKRRADPRKYEVADLLTLRSNDSGHISPEYDFHEALKFHMYGPQWSQLGPTPKFGLTSFEWILSTISSFKVPTIGNSKDGLQKSFNIFLSKGYYISAPRFDFLKAHSSLAPHFIQLNLNMSYHATDPSQYRDAPFTFQETEQMPFIGSEEPRQHLPHDQPSAHYFTNGSNLTQYYTGDSDAHYSAYNDQIVLEHSTDEASNAHLISQYSSQAATALPQSNNDTQPLDRTASFGALLVPHGTPLLIRPDPSQLQQPYFEQPYVDLNVTRKLDSNQYGSQSAVSDQQLAIIANGAIGTPGRTYLALPTSTSTPSMIAGDTNGML